MPFVPSGALCSLQMDDLQATEESAFVQEDVLQVIKEVKRARQKGPQFLRPRVALRADGAACALCACVPAVG